jgi:polyferredoxin
MTDPSGPRSGTPRRRAGGWRAARWARRAAQTASFVFFVYLLFAGLQRLAPDPYASIYFRFDPLAALATMLAARAWLAPFALALITLASALVLGRVWCGWICPLGTLLGWLRFRSARELGPRVPDGLRRVKYVLLGAIVVLAALQNLTLLVLDPLALLTRTLTTSVVPGFVLVVDTLERLGMTWGPTTGAVSWVEDHFRGSLLPTIQPRYEQAVLLFLVLLGVVLLGLLADRFWCRYLCPLGALLGLAAKVQVLRPLASGACGSCGACAGACRQDAIETGVSGARVVTSECTMCLDCLVACPRPTGMTLGVGRPGPWATYDPGRRDVVVAIGAGVGAAVLLGTGVARAVKRPGLVRPPGAQDEAEFLSRCLRCAECIKTCPTSGLQPTLLEAGLEGIWTPVLRSRLGYCDYACNACGQICPSGAIPPLPLPEKRAQILGLAVIDTDRCLPWAQDTPCIVCQEMCPVADKAIELRGERLITRAGGRRDYLARPVVVADRCIGCGICEYKCPLEGPAAIVVGPADPDLTGAGAPLG